MSLDLSVPLHPTRNPAEPLALLALLAFAVALTPALVCRGESPQTAPAATPAAPAATPATPPPAPAAPPAAVAATSEKLKGEFVTTASGLKIHDLKVGDGPEAAEGDTVACHYTGWLTDDTKFDSSHDRGRPFPVQNLGKASVIKGWNEGIVGMHQGGSRRLVIPPSLAYGPSGRGKIPPNATLIFDIEAVEVSKRLPPPAFPDLGTLALTSSPSGLRSVDLMVGEGAEVVLGSTATVHYSGWLEDGTPFDNSYERGAPMPVANVGEAGVIKGWNEGLVGMKVGGKRLLVIPPDLAYGANGYPGAIPPNATLIFQVECVGVS